jgi:hypothetical protein
MRFDDRIANSNFTFLDPEKTPGGDILLAERFVYDPQHGGCIETLWCIRRDKEDSGRTVFQKTDIPPEVRRAAAIIDATQWIADNIEGGRYSAS